MLHVRPPLLLGRREGIVYAALRPPEAALVTAINTHESDAVCEWAAEAAERLKATIMRWDERKAADNSLFEQGAKATM